MNTPDCITCMDLGKVMTYAGSMPCPAAGCTKRVPWSECSAPAPRPGRPPIYALPTREARPLRHTFRTWSRELSYGRMAWRIYRPHRGAAIFSAVIVPPNMSRAEVAAQIREHRRIIWGRDKLHGENALAPPADSVTPDPAPEDAAAPKAPAEAEDVAALESPEEAVPKSRRARRDFGPAPRQMTLF